jgi:hypothetical protein
MKLPYFRQERVAEIRRHIMTEQSRDELFASLDQKVDVHLMLCGNCAQTAFLALQEQFNLDDGGKILKTLTAFPGVALLHPHQHRSTRPAKPSRIFRKLSRENGCGCWTRSDNCLKLCFLRVANACMPFGSNYPVVARNQTNPVRHWNNCVICCCV